MLKQIAPNVTRVAVVRDAAITAGIGFWGAIQSVSPSFGVELRPVDVRDAGEIERALTAFAGSPNGGLIVTASALAVMHRDLIIALAARHRLGAWARRACLCAGARRRGHRMMKIYLLRCVSLLLARSVGSLRRSHTSGVGGEADMPTSLKRRDW